MCFKRNIVLVLLLILGYLYAQPEAYRDLYLERNALSARTMALGMTGAAVYQDNYDAVFTNPAAISTRPNFLIKSESTMADVSRFAVYGTFSLQGPETVAASALTLLQSPTPTVTEAITFNVTIVSTNEAVITENSVSEAEAVSVMVTPDETTVSMAAEEEQPLVSIAEVQRQPRLSLAYSKIAVSDIAIAELSGTEELRVADIASYAEQAFLLGYAQNIAPDISVGVAGKYFKNSLNIDQALYDQGNATGGDIDLGVLWQNPSLDIGFGYRNVLSALSPSGVLHWDTGVQSSFDHGFFVGLHKNYAQNISLTADIFNSRIQSLVYGVGLEYTFIRELRLRCGYNSLQSASLGLGLVLNNQLVVDYAYLPNFGTAVDTKHFFSLSWLF